MGQRKNSGSANQKQEGGKYQVGQCESIPPGVMQKERRVVSPKPGVLTMIINATSNPRKRQATEIGFEFHAGNLEKPGGTEPG